MHDIDKKEHDLIIIGSRLHTVPVGYSNIGMLPIYQQDLLFAALPDACILCVNYYDDTDYIKRTIGYIESICDAKVIVICVSVFGGSSRWTTLGVCHSAADEQQVCDGRKRISECFKIPVYMYDEVDKISQEIINYFSEGN